METRISLERAIQLLLERFSPITDTVLLPLDEANGRILAQDVYSPIAQPPFDRSPLDGYALRSEDIASASPDCPVTLEVIGENCAGGVFDGVVGPGQALRIMTGACLPKGCDCVIRQEDTDCGEKMVAVYRPVRHHQNYCFAGEDMKQGQLLMKAGEKLNFAHLGVLAAAGIDRALVYRPLRAAILNTGDEVMLPGQPLLPGKIYNANRQLLASRLQDLGIRLVDDRQVGDDPELAASFLRQMLPQVDFMITTGGVSVGKKDIMHQVLPLCGAEQIFWRLQMKPGTPMIGACLEGKPVLCLSGNPFASIATFELVVRPLLARLGLDSSLTYQTVTGVLAEGFDKESMGRRFIRARYENGTVHLPQNHSSGVLASLIGCNALVDIPAGSPPLPSGTEVQTILL